MASYNCVQACSQSFRSERGLSRHQDACKVALDQWRKDLEEVGRNKDAAKKRRHEEVGLARREQDEQSNEVPHIGNVQHEPVQPELLGRGHRKKRAAKMRPQPIVDILPSRFSKPFQVLASSTGLCKAGSSSNATFRSVEQATFISQSNEFGLHRLYPSKPTLNPEDCFLNQDLTAFEVLSETEAAALTPSPLPLPLQNHLCTARSVENSGHADQWFYPFPNATVCRIMNWFWNSSSVKSISDVERLVHHVLQADDFRREELLDFNVRKETTRLDGMGIFQRHEHESRIEEVTKPLSQTLIPRRDGWKEISVKIPVPDGKVHASESDASRLVVTGLHCRSLVEVIRSVFQSKTALQFHLIPFKQYWTPPTLSQRTSSNMESPQRVYDELYSSDIWLEAHNELQQQPRDEKDELEWVIAGLMFWSDSTHLTNFGSTSLWPIYLFFGNQSKYVRAKPSSRACHHLAYIPELPESFVDALKELTGIVPSDETITHCRRELMQAILAIIFDEEFTDAYRSGLVIKFVDGVTRRVFPRIFTWSADYKEKVLLASIKQLGNIPCTRCLTPRLMAHDVGSPASLKRALYDLRVDNVFRRVLVESARESILKDGKAVNNADVKRLLDGKSLLPITNHLSTILSEFGKKFYEIFVVDLMHEMELGVWRMIFVHLLRLLHAIGPIEVASLNERFRAISTFGDTIRKFTGDVAAMEKPAARDFEDILQCAMPAFEGLFPAPHDSIVLDLLFSIATWHALAKLRLHTDTTLTMLEASTKNLGAQLRHFKDNTCEAYFTSELPSEARKRERQRQQRKQRKGDKGKAKDLSHVATTSVTQPEEFSPSERFAGKGAFVEGGAGYQRGEHAHVEPGSSGSQANTISRTPDAANPSSNNDQAVGGQALAHNGKGAGNEVLESGQGQGSTQSSILRLDRCAGGTRGRGRARGKKAVSSAQAHKHGTTTGNQETGVLIDKTTYNAQLTTDSNIALLARQGCQSREDGGHPPHLLGDPNCNLTCEGPPQNLDLQRGINKKKGLNLNTYKVHALEHHAPTIRRYGTTDSYSTQPGELEHRRIKQYYARTNKNGATAQVAKLERREHFLRTIMEDDPLAACNKTIPTKRKRSSEEEVVSSSCQANNQAMLDSGDDPSPEFVSRYHISHSETEGIYLPTWLRENGHDPAFKDFYDSLKDHLLGRLLGILYDGDETPFSSEDRGTVIIENNRIYMHHVLRVNYTSYDVRRCQDSINPRTHADVMLLAREDLNGPGTHPYWYARVIKIFHAKVRHVGPASRYEGTQTIDLLWIRWFGRATHMASGWAVRRLHAIGFVPVEDLTPAFGFLDPKYVLRGVHLIPAFHHRKTTKLLPYPSITRRPEDKDEDWELYYVNSFVDRDMIMRYIGHGVGHRAISLVPMLNSGSDLQDKALLARDHASSKAKSAQLQTKASCLTDSESDPGSASETDPLFEAVDL